MPNFEEATAAKKDDEAGENTSWVDLAEGKIGETAEPNSEETTEGSEAREQDLQQENIESTEQLRANLERLNGNYEKIDAIPENVLQSPEGKEATQSFLEKITDRVKDFGQQLAKKFDNISVKHGKAPYVLMAAGYSALLLPTAMQFARMKWPEVGAALDAMPELVQSFIHMDFANSLSEKFGDSQFWITNTGNIDGMNLLADISSGRVDAGALSAEQASLLENTLSAQDLDTLKAYVANPQMVGSEFVDASVVAETDAGGIAVVKGLSNLPPIAVASFGIGALINKVGKIAHKYAK